MSANGRLKMTANGSLKMTDKAAAVEPAWQDAERRIRTELRRLDDVVTDVREATRDLRWRGPGAGRFRWRTDRRVRELHDQAALVEMLLTLVRRAALVPYPKDVA
jgi:hypothetical protein